MIEEFVGTNKLETYINTRPRKRQKVNKNDGDSIGEMTIAKTTTTLEMKDDMKSTRKENTVNENYIDIARAKHASANMEIQKELFEGRIEVNIEKAVSQEWWKVFGIYFDRDYCKFLFILARIYMWAIESCPKKKNFGGTEGV